MTTMNENKQFLNDVLYRNYFLDFKRNDAHKQIDFIFPIKDKISTNHLQLNNNFNFDIISNNLKQLVNWYKENNFKCIINLKNIDDFLSNDYISLLDTFLNLNDVHLNLYTNMSFLNNFELTKLIITYIQKLQNNNIYIHFNINLDGLYCDNINSEEFYNKLLTFLSNYEYWEFFSYITPENIENWIQNYQWWISKLDVSCLDKIHLIEDTNKNWSLEAIQNFISFIDFQVDLLSGVLKDNFQNFIFNQLEEKKICFTNIQLINQGIMDNSKYYRDCAFHNSLSIDLSNLKLLLCGNINYKNFSIGHFNGIDWEPEIVELSMLTTHLKRSSTPHCEKCQFIELCPGFCYAKSFDYIYNPLIPIRQYCNLITAKYNFLIYKYITLDLFDFSKVNNIPPYFEKYLKDLITRISLNLQLEE